METNEEKRDDKPVEVPSWIVSFSKWMYSWLTKILKFILYLLPLWVLIYVLIQWRDAINWLLLLSYVKVLVWPLVILIALYVFHQPIKSMLRNQKLKNIKAGLVNVGFDSDPPQPDPLNAKELVEETSKVEAEASPAVSSDSDEIRQLRENFDGLLLLYEFERAYRAIFGSQIGILQRLSQYKSLPLQDLVTFYEQHVQKSGGNPIYSDTAGLIGFLVKNGFVTYTNGQYTISNKGQLFLNYIQDQNLPLAKAY